MKFVATRIIFLIGLITILAGSIGLFYFFVMPKDGLKEALKSWFREEESVSSKLDLPHQTGILEMTVIPLHPVLKEFKYKLRVIMRDGRLLNKLLEIQSGGEPDVTIIWIEKFEKGPYLGFDHYSGSERIFEIMDLQTETLNKFLSLAEAKKALNLPSESKVFTIGWIRNSVLTIERNSGSSLMP